VADCNLTWTTDVATSTIPLGRIKKVSAFAFPNAGRTIGMIGVIPAGDIPDAVRLTRGDVVPFSRNPFGDFEVGLWTYADLATAARVADVLRHLTVLCAGAAIPQQSSAQSAATYEAAIEWLVDNLAALADGGDKITYVQPVQRCDLSWYDTVTFTKGGKDIPVWSYNEAQFQRTTGVTVLPPASDPRLNGRDFSVRVTFSGDAHRLRYRENTMDGTWVNDNSWVLYFTSEASAQRVANALKHLTDLCRNPNDKLF
jgi:hypothetical protein